MTSFLLFNPGRTGGQKPGFFAQKTRHSLQKRQKTRL
jgi:hypothetical protein